MEGERGRVGGRERGREREGEGERERERERLEGHKEGGRERSKGHFQCPSPQATTLVVSFHQLLVTTLKCGKVAKDCRLGVKIAFMSPYIYMSTLSTFYNFLQSITSPGVF